MRVHFWEMLVHAPLLKFPIEPLKLYYLPMVGPIQVIYSYYVLVMSAAMLMVQVYLLIQATIPMQPEIKTGVIVLQSSDSESGPHTYITRDATNLILAVSEALWANQPPTRLPPNAKEYIGNFTIKVGTPHMHTFEIDQEYIRC